jgi:hypothetical protein
LAGEPWSPRRRRRFEALAALYAFIGGSVATALLFAELTFGAIAIGLALTFMLAVVTAIRSKASGAVGIMVAYSFAFTLLTWPVPFVVALVLSGGWQ